MFYITYYLSAVVKEESFTGTLGKETIWLNDSFPSKVQKHVCQFVANGKIEKQYLVPMNNTTPVLATICPLH